MRVPPEYTAKVEKIKNIILSRSGLISEYGLNNIKMEVDEFYDSSENGVEEIVFSLRLNFCFVNILRNKDFKVHFIIFYV